ncbi:hypothetical protein LCGC14_1842340 [marine sediment metagenome]|uniref:Uncharacterized protein n=1 Tax=marine sediment metagenome TaxID=412755 RepID=A0A0F9ISD3_9ZZZZ
MPKPKTAEVEVLPPEPPGESMVELLRGGAAITRIENETMAQIALTRPRDLRKVLASAIEELELDPEFAEKQYYRIPYKDRSTDPPTTTWVTGLSIKAAVSLARCFGNINCTARVVEETDHAVVVEGVAIDMEKSFRVSKPVAISKFYRSKKPPHNMVKWSADRFPQILAAGASKAMRNAILNIIPESIQNRYWNRAKQLAVGGSVGEHTATSLKVDRRTIIGKILTAFEPYKVGREHLESHLKCKMEDAKSEELGDLKGILNAIEQGQTTPYEAFMVGLPPEKKAEEPKKPEKGTDQLFGGKAE